MTDLASLAIRIDSTETKGAVNDLNNLTEAGKRAEAANSGFARSGQQVVASAGQQRAGMQQLSFQIGDVAQQFALGTNPMIIFAQQGQQVVQAISLMRGSAGGLVGFLAGPWGAALTGAVMILGSLWAAHEKAAAAEDKHKASAEDLTKAINELNSATIRSANSTYASIAADIDKANSMRLRAIETRKAAVAELELAKSKLATDKSLTPTSGSNPLGRFLGGQIQKFDQIEVDRLNGQIADLNAGIAKSAETIRLQQGMYAGKLLAESLDASAAATGKYERRQDALNKQLREGRITLEDYSVSLRQAMVARDGELAAAKDSERTHRERRASMSAEEKALKRQNDETERFIENLQNEIDKIGLNAAQLRVLEIAKARDAAATDKQKDKIVELGLARERALMADRGVAKAAEYAKAVQSINKADADRLAQLDREFALLGKVGAEREVAALALEKEAFMASHVRLGLEGATAAWEEYYQTSLRNIYEKSRLEKDAEAAERARDAIAELVSTLRGLGGVGGAIGGLLEGVGRGSFANLGPIGALADMAIAGPKAYKKQADEIAKALKDSFGIKKGLADDIAGILQGASTGTLASTALLGQKGNNIGAAIGGAIGQAAGTAIAGPIGGAIGSALGGVLGGLVGAAKVKKGYAVVNQSGVTAGGNSADLMASSRTSGTGIQNAINAIAEQLGGSVGNYAVSIGKRSSGWIRVSASGSSAVADKSFAKKGGADLLYNGKDEAEAMRVAILNAIRDGAITGIRAGAQALISKEGDIETQLSKALKFQNVFDELKQRTDPLGFALGQVSREFESLKKIFDEAGASAAEYADLESYIAMKRQEAVDAARKSSLDRITDQFNQQITLLGLLGKSEEAVTAGRILEISGMKASLQPMQALIYELQDARDVIDKFGPLADDLRAYRKELLGGSTSASYAYLAAQFRSTADAAMTGDATALGSLRSVSGSFLEAAKNNARSALDYQRAVGEVLASVDKGIFAADTQVAMAQAQIDAVAAQTNVLQAMRSEIAAANVKLVEQSAAMLKLWQRFEGDGLTVKTDADTPLATTTA